MGFGAASTEPARVRSTSSPRQAYVRRWASASEVPDPLFQVLSSKTSDEQPLFTASTCTATCCRHDGRVEHHSNTSSTTSSRSTASYAPRTR
eukprot:7101133-Heterocapsa_arctica.AAC.1